MTHSGKYKSPEFGAPRWLSLLNFGLLISAQVMIPHLMSSSPMSSSVLTARSLLGIPSLSLSLKINKRLKTKKYVQEFRLYLFIYLFIYLLILRFLFVLFSFERERAWAGEGQREKGRERILSRLYTVSTEPCLGFKLMNHEIMTWAKVKSWMLNWLSHPGPPRLWFRFRGTTKNCWARDRVETLYDMPISVYKRVWKRETVVGSLTLLKPSDDECWRQWRCKENEVMNMRSIARLNRWNLTVDWIEEAIWEVVKCLSSEVTLTWPQSQAFCWP